MTVSLAAVFIPVLFMGGIVGRLFHEFAVTIVAAILVSGVVSLTLTPMLCSRMLKAQPKRRGTRVRPREAVLRAHAAACARSSAYRAVGIRRDAAGHGGLVRDCTQGVHVRRRHGAAHRDDGGGTGYFVRRDVGEAPCSRARDHFESECRVGGRRARQRRQWRAQQWPCAGAAEAARRASVRRRRRRRAARGNERNHRTQRLRAEHPVAPHRRAVVEEPVPILPARCGFGRAAALGAARRREAPCDAGLRGREHRSHARQPEGPRGHRPGPRGSAWRHRRSDRERTVHRLWRAPGLDDLRAE